MYRSLRLENGVVFHGAHAAWHPLQGAVKGQNVIYHEW